MVRSGQPPSHKDAVCRGFLSHANDDLVPDPGLDPDLVYLLAHEVDLRSLFSLIRRRRRPSCRPHKDRDNLPLFSQLVAHRTGMHRTFPGQI